MTKRAASKAPKVGSTQSPDTGLTPAQEAFARSLADGKSQADALREAYPKTKHWKPESIHQRASVLAGTPKVVSRVSELLALAAKANEVDVAATLAAYLAILQADPRELTSLHIVPCRYCYGRGHRYQRTDGELEDDRDKHNERRAVLLENDRRDIGEFPEKGGGGYTVLRDPNPQCPSCGGAGAPRVVLGDTRRLSDGARALFIGAKEGKDGIEVKLADREHALLQVARHVGFFVADNQVEVTAKIDTAELDAMYDQALAKSKAAGASAKGRLGRLRAKGVKV
jgi:phage terminase small subunit